MGTDRIHLIHALLPLAAEVRERPVEVVGAGGVAVLLGRIVPQQSLVLQGFRFLWMNGTKRRVKPSCTLPAGTVAKSSRVYTSIRPSVGTWNAM
jgi:hypothetical protein